MITKKIKKKINIFNGGIMKKILLGILILCCFQELKAATAVPVIVQRNAALEKERNNFSGGINEKIFISNRIIFYNIIIFN